MAFETPGGSNIESWNGGKFKAPRPEDQTYREVFEADLQMAVDQIDAYGPETHDVLDRFNESYNIKEGEITEGDAENLKNLLDGLINNEPKKYEKAIEELSEAGFDEDQVSLIVERKLGRLDPEAVTTVDGEDESDLTIERTREVVLNDLKRLAGELTADERTTLTDRLERDGIILPDHINEDTPDGRAAKTKLLEAVEVVDGTRNATDGKGAGWESKEKAKLFLESLGVPDDVNNEGVETPPTEEDVRQETPSEIVRKYEDLYADCFLKFEADVASVNDRIDSIRLLEDLGFDQVKIDALESRIVSGDITAYRELFNLARNAYLGIVVGVEGMKKMDDLSEEMRAMLATGITANKESGTILRNIISLSIDAARSRGWEEPRRNLLINILRERYGLIEKIDDLDRKLDQARIQVMEALEEKLQFDIGAKMLAPNLGELNALIDKLDIPDEAREEMRSLAGLMLVSRSTLYMKQDARVWSGVSPDTYQDGGWISIAKKGLEDTMITGILSGKETELLKKNNVSKVLQELYRKKSDNSQGTSAIDIRNACQDLSIGLGVSEYEARLGWMLYEQLFEPEYNSKNHLFGLTNSKESCNKLKSIWWGSEWILKNAVVTGELTKDPYSDDAPEGENGMPEKMWTATGERLFLKRSSTERIDLKSEVEDGRGVEFFQEFFNVENIAVNQGVLTKLQNSATVMQAHHKKITEVGKKPETTSARHLLEIKATLLRDISESDPRKNRGDGRYDNEKTTFMSESDIKRTLVTASRVIFLHTSVLSPGVDEKTLIDPAVAATAYLVLAASYDRKNNYFSFIKKDEDRKHFSNDEMNAERDLRDFVFEIAKRYSQDETLMAELRVKNEPRYSAVKRLIKNRDGWPVPEGPKEYRELHKIFQERFGYDFSIQRKILRPLTERSKTSEDSLNDWLERQGSLGKWLSGR